MRNSWRRKFSSQVSGNFSSFPEFVSEALLIVRVLDQVFANILDVYVAVSWNAVSMFAVGHEAAIMPDGFNLKFAFFMYSSSGSR